MISNEEKMRYGRQLILEDFGEEAQEKLKKSTVFIAGMGGLGSPAALYLAAAGVGNIKICDNDVIELSNLNRQIIHNTNRIDMLKAESAKKNLTSLNPTINIEAYTESISTESIEKLANQTILIIDCLDNIETRYIINEFALGNNIPIVHGGVRGLAGQASLIVPGKTPCLKCIFPVKPEKSTIPVLGATAGVIGSIQAMEAIKFLTGMPGSLENTLLLYDGSTQNFERISIIKDPDCEACGKTGMK
jgi:molybdopterin-synthase adenylyltransferase